MSEVSAGKPLRVAIAAGETSGDALGAGLIRALKERTAVECFGIAGPRMVEAGCAPWHGTDELSVMGLMEVLPHLRRLLKLRRRLIERIEAARPDVYIGVDSSDFNLPVEAALKAAGIPTVQYVSPQVWAWRQARVHKIGAATDLVLCLLPFEAPFYAEHGVNARFVGHPLADEIPLDVDAGQARSALGLPADARILALLPGSRRAEVERLAGRFLGTAAWLAARDPALRFVVAAANDVVAEIAARAASELRMEPAPRIVTGKARQVIAAADVVLTASGTASLECLLLKRPMVVAHRLSPLTYGLVRRLGVGRLENFSLPNLLAGRRIVAEYVQRQVRPDILGPALLECFEHRRQETDWYEAFTAIHRRLRCRASETAADAVLALVGGQGR
jgi:lipid-A-disaccharide synthase